jgi:hypothetical protein
MLPGHNIAYILVVARALSYAFANAEGIGRAAFRRGAAKPSQAGLCGAAQAGWGPHGVAARRTHGGCIDDKRLFCKRLRPKLALGWRTGQARSRVDLC